VNAAAARDLLIAEGIDCVLHRDGTLTARLTKPREQSWSRWLRDRVKALPGAVVTLVRERPAADPWLEHAEVRFAFDRLAMVGHAKRAA
jgi:hypothetical protein